MRNSRSIAESNNSVIQIQESAFGPNDVREASAKLNSYKRLMDRHLQCQMEANGIASYRQKLYAHTRKQLAHRHRSNRKETNDEHMVDLQSALSLPLCADFSHLSIRGDPGPPRKSLPRELERPRMAGRNLRSILKGSSREDAVQTRCRELMGETAMQEPR